MEIRTAAAGPLAGPLVALVIESTTKDHSLMSYSRERNDEHTVNEAKGEEHTVDTICINNRSHHLGEETDEDTVKIFVRKVLVRSELWFHLMVVNNYISFQMN